MAEDTPSATLQEYYKLINAGGNHYDIGRKMTDAFTEKLHRHFSSPVDATKLENATKSMEAVFAMHPVLRDELQGIAEGISIEFESMLVEIFDYAARPTRSMTVVTREGDSVVVGRSFSASPDTFVRNLLRLDPNDSYASLGRMSGYFGGTWESIGVYGQFVCADILAGNQRPRQGVAAYMVPRIVTESSKSIETAMDKLGSVTPMHDSAYVVADAKRAYALTFENGKSISREITSFPFVMVDGREVGHAGALEGTEDMKSLMSDHKKGGCVHTADTETLYAMIVDMGSELIEYTNGAPCSAPYSSVDWPGGYG